MILVDTSVWVDYLRAGDTKLANALRASQVATHPFVIGELACGNLKSREAVLSLLRALPVVPVADDDEALHFIEQHALMGRGIGYIDAHLLAATAIATPTRLWTHDKRLAAIAAELALAHRATSA